MQPVGRGQAPISVRPLHEFVAKTGTPVRGKLHRLREGSNVQTAGVSSADFHSKGIVESEGGSQGQSETVLIFVSHLLVDCSVVAGRVLLEDCRQSCAGVFGVHVNPSSQDGLLADVGSRQIEPPLYLQIGVRLDQLGHDLGEKK